MTTASQHHHRQKATQYRANAGHHRMAAQMTDKVEDQRIHEAKAYALEHQAESHTLLAEAEKREHQQRIHDAKTEELRGLANGMNDQETNQAFHAQADAHALQAQNHQLAAERKRGEAAKHDQQAHELWREIGRREGK